MLKTYRLLFWLALIFAMTMALLPHPPSLPGEPSDKLQHMAAFVTLSVLAVLAYPGVSKMVIAAGLIALGALIEVLQMIPALHRDAEVLDLAADGAAVVAAILIFVVAGAVRSRR